MKISDLVRAMEELAPTRFAAPWDNVGLLVGDPEYEVARALLAVDCTRAVLDEAVRGGCGAIVSYHPPIFEAQKRFVAGCIAFEAALAGVSIYSPHTALDVAEGGTNDVLADVLGMTDRRPLRVIDPRPGEELCSRIGFGRIGAVTPTRMPVLLERLKHALGVSHVLLAGDVDCSVSRAAVCAGSGGEFVPDAIRAGVDILVTGELRHHDALLAVAQGVSVVCTLHSVSERVALASLERRLASRMPGVGFARSAADRDPFTFA